jgi:hypothetical protein
MTAVQKAEEEASNNLAQLELLESKRNQLMKELEDAKRKVIQFVQPEADPEDVAAMALVPESPEDELNTLIQVADAVENSETDIDPKIKSNLEGVILDNIAQVAKEATAGAKVKLRDDFENTPAQNRMIQAKHERSRSRHPSKKVSSLSVDPINRIDVIDPFVEEEEIKLKMATGELDALPALVHKDKSSGDKETETKEKDPELDDLMAGDDPFSEFLREEMGM